MKSEDSSTLRCVVVDITFVIYVLLVSIMLEDLVILMALVGCNDVTPQCPYLIRITMSPLSALQSALFGTGCCGIVSSANKELWTGHYFKGH